MTVIERYMPSLNWIGKEKIVDHDKEVPFRLLKKHKGLSLGTSENLIIEGDNLEALKALMPYYVGKVKCIYIDPPYNTGNEGWVYNDNVNSPKIKQWIGKVVGNEGEDLTRHDKWLCMMYPRLKLLRELLHDDGVIFISIDDNEHCHLKIIMDEIFGVENFVTSFIWQKKTGASDSVSIAVITEYIMVYVKSNDNINNIFERNKNSYDLKRYSLVDEFEKERGPYYIDNLDRGGLQYSDSLNYPIICPDGEITYPNGRKDFVNDGWIWKWGKKKIQWAIENKFIEFRKSNKKQSGWSVCYKNYLFVDNEGNKMERSAPIKNLITDILNANSAAGIKSIFGENVFKYSKPVGLIKKLISFVKMADDSIVLDSFAGSGTTGQAVFELNKEDNMNRRFILVEIEKDIAQRITSERIRRVSKDLGGGFEYCTLGNKLFNADRAIDEDVVFDDLANYIYFTETQTNLEKKQISGNFIGEHNESDFYLLFKEKGKNTLTKSFLKNVTKNDHKKIIYADFCTIPDEILQLYKITCKQIPYEVKVY